MGGLSTHILDTHGGKPAAGVTITLDRLQPDGSRETLIETRRTRMAAPTLPLLAEDYAARHLRDRLRHRRLFP